MNLEETKKIIENKIEAEALTRNVRSQIKSYIDQKQNVREGFKETFQPLITSQDAVKASIDKEQNAMIKQLQANQLALTKGLDKNRLAITQGFDKMDEVKRWDLSQLPGFEAIEEPEKETFKPAIEGKKITYKLSNRDLNKIVGFNKYEEDGDKFLTEEEFKNLNGDNKYEIFEEYLSPDLIKVKLMPKAENDPIYKMSRNDFYRITGQENKLKEDGEKEFGEFKESQIDRIISEKTDLNKYRVDKDKDLKIVQVFKRIEPSKPLIYGDEDINKLLDEEDKKRLKFYLLKLPSAYKDVSLE